MRALGKLKAYSWMQQVGTITVMKGIKNAWAKDVLGLDTSFYSAIAL